MIEIKYRWQEKEEETFETEDDTMKKENKDDSTESSMLWIKVLCDRQARDHDEILKEDLNFFQNQFMDGLFLSDTH